MKEEAMNDVAIDVAMSDLKVGSIHMKEEAMNVKEAVCADEEAASMDTKGLNEEETIEMKMRAIFNMEYEEEPVQHQEANDRTNERQNVNCLDLLEERCEEFKINDTQQSHQNKTEDSASAICVESDSNLLNIELPTNELQGLANMQNCCIALERLPESDTQVCINASKHSQSSNIRDLRIVLEPLTALEILRVESDRTIEEVLQQWKNTDESADLEDNKRKVGNDHWNITNAMEVSQKVLIGDKLCDSTNVEDDTWSSYEEFSDNGERDTEKNETVPSRLPGMWCNNQQDRVDSKSIIVRHDYIPEGSTLHQHHKPDEIPQVSLHTINCKCSIGLPEKTCINQQDRVDVKSIIVRHDYIAVEPTLHHPLHYEQGNNGPQSVVPTVNSPSPGGLFDKSCNRQDRVDQKSIIVRHDYMATGSSLHQPVCNEQKDNVPKEHFESSPISLLSSDNEKITLPNGRASSSSDSVFGNEAMERINSFAVKHEVKSTTMRQKRHKNTRDTLPQNLSNCNTDEGSVIQQDNLNEEVFFDCNICEKKFTKKKYLTVHQRIHNREDKFKCDTCDKSFQKKSDLNIHMCIHTGKKTFKCDICFKRFLRKTHLKRHQLNHSVEKPLRCNTCQKLFRNNEFLTKHQLTHIGEKPFKCNICLKRFLKKTHLKRHQLIHTRKKPLQCDTCPKLFKNSEFLKKHQLTHTSEKPFKCHTCDKTFKDKSRFKEHLKIHVREKRFKCETCGKCFIKKYLWLHFITHTGLEPFRCDTCGNSFTCKERLERHMRIHMGENSFKCNVCLMCFIHNTSLSYHMQSHTGKKYNCDNCGNMFTDKSALQNHMEIHTDAESFHCRICLKCFSDKTTLDNHLQVHIVKTFKCGTCGYRFTAKQMRIHISEKPFKCHICLQCFTHQTSLSKHLQIHNDKKFICDTCGNQCRTHSELTMHQQIHSEEVPLSTEHKFI